MEVYFEKVCYFTGSLFPVESVLWDSDTGTSWSGIFYWGEFVVWYIHNPEYPEPGNCIIFHKNRASHPYHRNGRAGSLRQAVRSLQGHDRYQIEVREGGGRKEGSRVKEEPH